MIKQLLPILLILSIVLSSSGCMDFSTLSVSQPMPVRSVDYQKSTGDQLGGYYWRIATLIDGNGESYVLEMPASELQSGDIKAQKTLKLYFVPTQPYWHGNCYDENYLTYDYKEEYWSGMLNYVKVTDDVPYTRISGVSQTVHAGYTAILEDENGRELERAGFNAEDMNQGTLKMTVQDSDGFYRTIYITMDGLMPTGVLTPSGEMATLWSGGYASSDNAYMLVNYITLQNSLDTWNNYHWRESENWLGCFDWLVSNGVTDLSRSSSVQDFDFEGVGYIDGSHPTGVKLYYDTGTFKPLVTVYIPEQLAETIVEEKAAPEPSIKAISDMEQIEGGSVRWEVTVTNYGTSGDVKVSARVTDGSNGLQNIRTIGDSQVYIDKGKSYTWTMAADIADELTSDVRDVEVTVTANGGVGGQFGSTDTESFTVTVENKDVAEEEKVTLTIKTIYEETDEIFENGAIFVGDGSDARQGTGQVTYEAVKGIDLVIYSEDTSTYKAQYNESNPKVITPYTDREVVILFNTDRPDSGGGEFGDLDTVLIIVIIILSLVLIYMTGVWKYLIPLFQSPVLLAALILTAAIIWAVFEITGALESTSQTINNGLDSMKFWER